MIAFSDFLCVYAPLHGFVRLFTNAQILQELAAENGCEEAKQSLENIREE